MDAQECNIFAQLDPEVKNLTELKVVSKKLGEVSKALNQLQLFTDTLAQAVNIIAKNYAFSQIERINENLHIENETTGE